MKELELNIKDKTEISVKSLADYKLIIVPIGLKWFLDQFQT